MRNPANHRPKSASVAFVGPRLSTPEPGRGPAGLRAIPRRNPSRAHEDASTGDVSADNLRGSGRRARIRVIGDSPVSESRYPRSSRGEAVIFGPEHVGRRRNEKLAGHEMAEGVAFEPGHVGRRRSLPPLRETTDDIAGPRFASPRRPSP